MECVSDVRVQAKTHTPTGTHSRAQKQAQIEGPSSQYVLTDDGICNLQQKLAQNSRDELILMCGTCGGRVGYVSDV